MHNNWFCNAIFYSLDVESFYDSNNDGIGDFKGLNSKLDYLADLGVNCIWLLPFFPSPNRDNGYDVMDYYDIDKRLGTPEDFTHCIEKASGLGIRLIIDLVVNHTSVEHPWFLQARQDPGSKYRDYYIWTDEPLAYEKEHLMFTGEENTMWTYDEVAGQYYLHRFYKEQPDLNIASEAVQKEILKIIQFWLSLGVSGFRIDAAERLIESYGMKEVDKEKPLRFLNEMRSCIAALKSDAVLIAEANVPPQKVSTYIRGNKRMHMVFNFYVNQHLFLSLAEKNAQIISNALTSLPHLDAGSQWLNFLRHHDELNLSLLSEKEIQKVFAEYAPEENMRIYGRGIRRRLSPMVDGNRQQLEMYYSLLFSMPGVPLIRYGDEIGMGEDLSLKGRESVRTPMQWSDEKNGGFSEADKNMLVHPVISSGQYSYKYINVSGCQPDSRSLLNRMKKLIAIRKECPEIGLGQLIIFHSNNPRLFIHSYKWNDRQVYFIHNLSAEEVVFENNYGWEINSLLGSEREGKKTSGPIKGFEYKWFRVKLQ